MEYLSQQTGNQKNKTGQNQLFTVWKPHLVASASNAQETRTSTKPTPIRRTKQLKLCKAG
jgi:hypothetical protein